MTLRAVDSETCLISEFCKAPPLVCISQYGELGDGPSLFKWDDPEAKSLVNLWLHEDTIVGANIGYDMGVFAAQWPDLLDAIVNAYDIDTIVDIQLAEKLRDIALGQLHRNPGAKDPKRPYSLESLAWRYLRKEMDKSTWRLRYGELRDVSLAEWPAGAREYPVTDAYYTYLVWKSQENENLRTIADESRHAFWLHLLSCWGIRTDLGAVAELESATNLKLEERLKTLERAELIRRVKGEWVRNTKNAMVRMVEVCGDKARKTETGRISLDEEACRDSGDDVLKAYADYSSLKKTLSSDIPALRRGEIHARFDSLKETGRTGCGDPYNLQNPPTEGGVRECFVPRPGFLYIDADYDLLELRCFSQVCLELLGWSDMADVLNAGMDVHTDLACYILDGIPYEEGIRRKKAKDHAFGVARATAKNCNFGLLGGMGAPRFVLLCKNGHQPIIISEEYAKELIGTTKRRWTELPAYLRWASTITDEGPAYVPDLLGGGIHRGGCDYSTAANTNFQRLGAHVAKSAGWAIMKACYVDKKSPLYGSRIVSFVHDQFIIETPFDVANDAAVETGRLMVEAAKPWLPDVPATTTPCLATCFSKNAEAIYDANGRLLPWSPEVKKAA